MKRLANISRLVTEVNRTNLKPIENSIAQMTIMAMRKFNLGYDDAELKVREVLREDFEIKQPVVTFYERDNETLDRSLCRSSVHSYLKHLREMDVILSPSGTTYVKRNVRLSFLSKMSEEGKKERAGIKLRQFAAKNEGDSDLVDFLSGRSNGIKLAINTISGSVVSKGSILRNRSGHSTMTSNGRLTVSASNILCEYINGNRFYNTYEVAQSAILALLQSLDDPNNYKQRESWETVMSVYNLHVPTVPEIVELLTNSTNYYWHDKNRMSRLTGLVSTMSDLEKVAFVYTSDMYHFFKYNRKVGNDLYSKLAEKPKIGVIDNLEERLKEIPSDILTHTHHLLIEEMKGLGTNYDIIDPAIVGGLVRGGEKTMETLFEYKHLLQTIICSNYNGPNIVHIFDMIRHHIPASDTDSTVMSVDSFVELAMGVVEITPAAMRMGSAHALLFGQALDNALLQISVNMNVEPEYMKTMEMKTELTTTVIGVGSRSKQYFTNSTVLEGNVLTHPDLVVKGKELKSATIPHDIRKGAQARMAWVISEIEANRKPSLNEIFIEALNVEKRVYNELKGGGVEYFNTAVIKSTDSYKNTNGRSPFDWSIWYDRTFGKHVNFPLSVPFKTIMVPTTLKNKTKLNAWLESLPDGLREDMKSWVAEKGKTTLPTLYIPTEYLENNPIPDYFIDICNSREIVRVLSNIYYRVLEILGYLKSNDLLLCEALLGIEISEINDIVFEDHLPTVRQ